MEEELIMRLDAVNNNLRNIVFCVAIIARKDAYMDETAIVDKIIEKRISKEKGD